MSATDKAPRDLASDQVLVMNDLLTGQELRHSISPAVSDFTNAASVDPTELETILTQWHSHGIVFNKIPNDGFAQDGVQYRYKLNLNGYYATRTLQPPAATLTSISPTTGVRNSTVTITATGTGFDASSYIMMDSGASVQGGTVLDSATQVHADVLLPNVPSSPISANVAVANERWGTLTDPQTFTVTKN